MPPKTLFPDASPDLGECVFSPCRRYRYSLWRRWSDSSGYVQFIGLNPSTADERQDDPTIRRLRGFAEREGFGAMVMTNAFAFRATLPKDMKREADPVGADNDGHLRQLALNADRVVCCWGSHGSFRERSAAVLMILHSIDLFCFGKTAAGEPKHPLYLRADTPLVRMDSEFRKDFC